jgi:hypothetical protein
LYYEKRIYMPEIVKLRESPGKAGGLPMSIAEVGQAPSINLPKEVVWNLP